MSSYTLCELKVQDKLNEGRLKAINENSDSTYFWIGNHTITIDRHQLFLAKSMDQDRLWDGLLKVEITVLSNSKGSTVNRLEIEDFVYIPFEKVGQINMSSRIRIPPVFDTFGKNQTQLAPFKEQDRLDEGLLKPVKGRYFKSDNYFTIIDRHKIQLAPQSQQDKLREGLVKVSIKNFKKTDPDDFSKPHFEIDDYTYVRFGDIKKVDFTSECFIATAVYGNPHAEEVETLRRFRDERLRESGLGRLVVRAYYSGAGKIAAKFIQHKARFLIPPIKHTLDSIVENYRTEAE